MSNPFPANAYLHEYYRTVDRENLFLLRQLATYFRTIPWLPCLSDIGGGPTIYQLISAASVSKEIHFYEPDSACRAEVQSWLLGRENSFSWDAFIGMALRCEGRKEDLEAQLHRADLLRTRVTRLAHCNLHSVDHGIAPLPPCAAVSIHFATASISATQEEFTDVMSRVCSLVPKGGYLLFSELLGAASYAVLDTAITSYPTSLTEILDLLRKGGLETEIVGTLATSPKRGFDGIVTLRAHRS